MFSCWYWPILSTLVWATSKYSREKQYASKIGYMPNWRQWMFQVVWREPVSLKKELRWRTCRKYLTAFGHANIFHWSTYVLQQQKIDIYGDYSVGAIIKWEPNSFSADFQEKPRKLPFYNEGSWWNANKDLGIHPHDLVFQLRCYVIHCMFVQMAAIFNFSVEKRSSAKLCLAPWSAAKVTNLCLTNRTLRRTSRANLFDRCHF